MIYQFRNSEPRWINFENPKGEKGRGGIENNGAKGHPCEIFCANEEKILCDFDGCGVIRRIWITMNGLCEEMLRNVFVKMYWDNSEAPQVDVPIGDFFCMGLAKMTSFENHFFSTAEGRSFCCTIPMPFRKHAKITLYNAFGKNISHLFYDINLTLEELGEEDMYFHAKFSHILENELEKDVTILNCSDGMGRFIGTSIAVIPNEEKYGDLWWGEGEVKMYIDNDTEHATLVGTGAEDYVGSAWGLAEFINDSQGCVSMMGNSVSMYRFHVKDPIFFKENIKVTLQTIGGGVAKHVKKLAENGIPHVLVSYDMDEGVKRIYKKDFSQDELDGWVNFFRQDEYRIVAYYYVM